MLRLVTLMTATLMASAAFGHDFSVNGVVIDHPWSRATPPAASVAVGYMRITNKSDAPVTLVGGTADFADVEVHTMTMKDGMMRMAELPDGLTLAAGETVTLEPGGLHVMFTSLKAPFIEGQTRTATLDFGATGTVTVEFSVAPMGATHDPDAAH